jgi:hypothetical protein
MWSLPCQSATVALAQPGVQPGKAGITFAEGLCDCEDITLRVWWLLWLGGGGRRTVLPLNYTLASALQLKKNTENLRQGRVINRCVELVTLLRAALNGLLNIKSSDCRGWLQTALGSRGCLPSCRTKGFPASRNIVSKLLVSALMWSAKNRIPILSWISHHLNMAACNGPPDDACIFCRMTDELLIKKHTVSDGQATSFGGRQYLSWLTCVV